MTTNSMGDCYGCWTDQRLIRSTMALRLMSLRRGTKKPHCPCLNIGNLDKPKTKELLQTALCDNLPSEDPDDVEAHWKSFKTTIHNTSQDVFDLKTKCNPDWFDENNEEIEHLISKKHH